MSQSRRVYQDSVWVYHTWHSMPYEVGSAIDSTQVSDRQLGLGVPLDKPKKPEPARHTCERALVGNGERA